jgi:membrane protein YdbS with pleckstrin-like domain
LALQGLARQENPWAFLLLLIPSVLILAWFLTALFRLAMVRLDFEKRWYVVTDRSFRVREGVVFVREMTVTFANIQNISISQGPIQRAVGIADLRVDTRAAAERLTGNIPARICTRHGFAALTTRMKCGT